MTILMVEDHYYGDALKRHNLIANCQSGYSCVPLTCKVNWYGYMQSNNRELFLKNKL